MGVRTLPIPYLVLSKDVRAGQQLFRDYGLEWWMRHGELRRTAAAAEEEQVGAAAVALKRNAAVGTWAVQCYAGAALNWVNLSGKRFELGQLGSFANARESL